jgi:hypothetical protein
MDLLDGFLAGESVATLARRYGVTAGLVRRALVSGAKRLTEPEPDELDDGRLRCRACRILLDVLWCTWDQRGLCDDCQETLGDLAYLLRCSEDEALRLWLQPVSDDPNDLTALEKAVVQRQANLRSEAI